MTESKIAGTGLGMGIVKRYVDLMNGTISVDSEAGKGTVITTEIPHRIVHEMEEVQDVKEMDYSILKGKTVLLAEDNELNREIAEELLKDPGLQVRSASDGIECVSILTVEPAGTFDFILMDVQMPNMDGLKATITIRQMKDTAKSVIPIIAMTANVFDTDRKRAMEAGMDGFAGKPIQIEELKNELVRVLSERNEEKFLK